MYSSMAARLLGLRVLAPRGPWVSVCCECCVLSGRGLCEGPIPRPEESYRACFTKCDQNATVTQGPLSCQRNSLLGRDVKTYNYNGDCA
jgi:hypothetical protein